jgi:ribonucleoside-diphosphate reductase alpha chain
MTVIRMRLPNRRPNETFELQVDGLRYVCTVGRFQNGSISELFLSNCKPNSQADIAARDAAIVLSIAIQHGVDLETIRRSLSRDSHNRANGLLGAALDRILGTESQNDS